MFSRTGGELSMLSVRGWMRRATPGLVGLAAAVVALPAAAQDAEFVRPPSWTTPVEPVQIADQLWYVGSEELAAFLFTDPAGHVLVDATLDENLSQLLASIRAAGFDPADIRLLLASHAHFDHVGGLARLRETTGAEIALSEADARLVAAGGRGDFFLGDRAPYPPTPADRILRHGDTVRSGALELTAHLTPGHTRGCTSWSGEVTIDGQPHTFVSVCSLSVLEGYRLTADETAGDEPSYPGIAHDFCSSLAHLESLEPDIFLAPHASFFRMQDKAAARNAGDRKAFIDPVRYHDYLARAGARIEDALRDQGEPGGCPAILAPRIP